MQFYMISTCYTSLPLVVGECAMKASAHSARRAFQRCWNAPIAPWVEAARCNDGEQWTRPPTVRGGGSECVQTLLSHCGRKQPGGMTARRAFRMTAEVESLVTRTRPREIRNTKRTRESNQCMVPPTARLGVSEWVWKLLLHRGRWQKLFSQGRLEGLDQKIFHAPFVMDFRDRADVKLSWGFWGSWRRREADEDGKQ